MTAVCVLILFLVIMFCQIFFKFIYMLNLVIV